MNQLEKELLPYWRNMLKPQGLFRVIFPDFDAMLQDYLNEAMTFEQLALVTMGGQDYALDYHYSLFTVERVTHMLQLAGFHNIVVVERGRKNDICRESEIIATKEGGVEK
ncbi:hypothetical protein SDC9_211737 [bioreactor metagenome]|uniref:Uncharacterized protein n=1 Tax=bioreactor metagenome TaxID=1076179 RepID=A0A645JJX2_9ZZZZ